MSEYAQYYESFCQSRWATENAEDCRCHGGGWALSEVDTWHRCPIHGQGVPHPDDDGPPDQDGPELPDPSGCHGCGCEIHGTVHPGHLCGSCHEEFMTRLELRDDDVPF